MARSLVQRQVTRVRRRLFLTTLLALLAWCWLAALVGTAGWFVVQPFVQPEAPEALRWIVLGGLVGLGTIVGVVLSVRKAPTPVAAALALDERFGLRERVTTSLTFDPAQDGSPAVLALQADVETRLAAIRVPDRFPIQLPRLAMALLPASVLGLVLLALFWNPRLGAGAGPAEEDLAVAPASKEDLDAKMKQLATRKKPVRKEESQVASEELELINADIENFTRKPRETREDVRERIKDVTEIEEQIRRQQQEQGQRADAFREAMKQVERLTRKNRDPKNQEGPARNAADAMARGDLDRTADELQRLSRKLEKEEEKERLKRKKRDPGASEEEKKKADEELGKLEREQNLTEKEKEQLARQLEEMKDQLERLSRKKEDKEQELKDMADKGEIDKDTLERELDQLKKNEDQVARDKKDIDDLAKELGECKQCMQEGKNGEAAEKLAKASAKASKLGKGGESKEMARKLAQVESVRKALCRSLNQGGVGSGRRPETKDDDTGHQDTLVSGEFAKGKMEVVGQGPVGGFKGPRKPAEIQEEIEQAAQEAPAAIDRQRLPPSARKMARGYFEKMRGPDRTPKKP